MKLTYIQYQLPYYGIIDTEFRFNRNGNIQEFELWEAGRPINKEHLYLVHDDNQKEVLQHQDVIFCVWGCSSNTEILVKNGFFLDEKYSFPHIINIFNRLFKDYHTWELMLQYADEIDLSTLLDQSEIILRMPLAIADNRFHFLSKGYIYRTRFPSKSLDLDNMDELFWQQDFKRCVKKTHVFRLPLRSEEKELLCFNIIIGGHFYARLLGSVEDIVNASTQEHLFNRLAVTLNSIFADQRILLPQTKNSDLQKQVSVLLEGKTEVDREVMAHYGWKEDSRYIVMVLSFDASYPLEEGMRFLLMQMGELFPKSCVISEDRTLICVRNLDQERKENLTRERLSIFLRENVAKAGVSDTFVGYRHLVLYRKQALEALRLGSKKDPHFWHYEFHDYIMEYLLENMLREYPEKSIVHPGLYILEKYDAEKEANLYQTLKVYLESGCNATRAAENLFIHRSSLMKRLDKIRSLTGINTGKAKDRLYVEISLRLIEYQRKFKNKQ